MVPHLFHFSTLLAVCAAIIITNVHAHKLVICGFPTLVFVVFPQIVMMDLLLFNNLVLFL